MNNLPQQFEVLPVRNPHAADVTAVQAIEDALRVRAAYAIYKTVIHGIAKDKVANVVSTKQIFNEIYQQDQLTICTYHLAYYTVWSARRHLEKSNVKCPNLKKHLENLIAVFGLMELSKDPAPLYDCGYFKPGDGTQIFE